MKILIYKEGFEDKCTFSKYDLVIPTTAYTLSAYQIKNLFKETINLGKLLSIALKLKNKLMVLQALQAKVLMARVKTLSLVGVLPSRVEFIKDEYNSDSMYITRSIIPNKYTQPLDIVDKLIILKEFKEISKSVYYLYNNKRVELKLNIELGAEYAVTNVHTQMSMEIGYSELRKRVKSLTPTKEADDDNHTYFGHDAKMIGDYNPIKLTVNYYNMYKFKQWSTLDEKYILLYKGKSPVFVFGGDRITPNKTLSIDGNTARYKLASSTNNIQVSHKTNWKWNTSNKEDCEELDYYIDGTHCTMPIKVMKAIKTLFQITGRVDASELHQIAMVNTYNLNNYKYSYNSLEKVLSAHHTLVDWLNLYNVNVGYKRLVFEKQPDEDVCYEDNIKFLTNEDYMSHMMYRPIRMTIKDIPFATLDNYCIHARVGKIGLCTTLNNYNGTIIVKL